MQNFLSTMRLAAIIAAMVLTIDPAVAAHAASGQEFGIIGKWRLTKALDSADISSLDDQEAQRLVGRVFTISKKTVKVGNVDDCLPPAFDATIVEPSLYVRKWAHASAENLGLPNPVTVVDLGCTNAFIKSPKRIVVFWKGWFFDAKRMR